jgi:rhodanese-related sulfurtransferase
MSARGEAVIVDVRPREAYEAGHIPGALHVEALEIGARAAELRRLGRLPILYCG